jgi:hypothetical protein
MSSQRNSVIGYYMWSLPCGERSPDYIAQLGTKKGWVIRDGLRLAPVPEAEDSMPLLR